MYSPAEKLCVSEILYPNLKDRASCFTVTFRHSNRLSPRPEGSFYIIFNRKSIYTFRLSSHPFSDGDFPPIKLNTFGYICAIMPKRTIKKLVKIYMPGDLKQELKIYCAKNNTNMTKAVIKAVRKMLKR